MNSGQRYSRQYVPLHKAALIGDWKTAKKLLEDDPTLVKASITEGGETVLHIAVLQGHACFVARLLRENMATSYLKIQNARLQTALCFAAASGHIGIAELMVELNPDLPKIHGDEGVAPLLLAAREGKSEMAEYLFPLSGFESWTKEEQIELLTTSIDSGLYGLAVKIVNEYKMYAVVEDVFGETPLKILARKPSAFCNSSRRGICDHIANTILHFMKIKARYTSPACDACTLLLCLWNCVDDVEAARNPENISELLFIAAESGNVDFLVELIRRYPDLAYKVNNSKHSIFHIAVLRRHVNVFNLIYELHGVKDVIISRIDEDGNNILHLAAKLAPQNQLNCIPMAANQMRQELLWYKEVEKIVQFSYRNMKNLAKETPHELFLARHKGLMQEGEKQMKQIAKSCMLVTVLIATVVFTVAFTMPGGYDGKGYPILQNKKFFVVLPISEAIATLASFTSMLMFLSILTSRFSENEFLRSLPFLLVAGVSTLFFSIVAILVGFCTCLLFYNCGLGSVVILLILFATVPIMFIILKYRLLVTILGSIYSSRWLFRSNNRLFS